MKTTTNEVLATWVHAQMAYIRDIATTWEGTGQKDRLVTEAVISFGAALDFLYSATEVWKDSSPRNINGQVSGMYFGVIAHPNLPDLKTLGLTEWYADAEPTMPCRWYIHS